MTTIAPPERLVTGGVDTHLDLHVAAALDPLDGVLGTASFPTTAAGYRQLLAWLRSHGQVGRVGVEGTGTYGAALARHLTAQGVPVIEVNRPNRQVRRRHGKTDVIDAIAAARAVMSGEASSTPKSHNGSVEALRALKCCSAAQPRPGRKPSTSSGTCSSRRRMTFAPGYGTSRSRSCSRSAQPSASPPMMTACAPSPGSRCATWRSGCCSWTPAAIAPGSGWSASPP